MKKLTRLILFLFLFSFSIVNATSNSTIGERRYLRANDEVPESPEGTMWKIIKLIRNTGRINLPGRPSNPTGPYFFELELVKGNPSLAGNLHNSLEVGGLISGNSTSFVKRLIFHEGEPILGLYQKLVALIEINYIVGKTSVTIKDGEELKVLPKGYQWLESRRLSGAGSLIPSAGGSFDRSPDKVTYVLSKTNRTLPDQFSLMEVESRVAERPIMMIKPKNCAFLFQ